MNRELDQARAVFYALFGVLFSYEAPKRSKNELISMLETIESSNFDEAGVVAASELLDVIASDLASLEDEFSELFVLPFGDGVAITASIYHDDREAGEPLIRVRELLYLAKLHKEDSEFTESEDHFGFIFNFASQLIRLEVDSGDGVYRTIMNSLYSELISPYAPQFAKRIASHKTAKIYKSVATLLDRFLAFEASYYASLK